MSDRAFKAALQLAGDLADKASDDSGFVPMHSLANAIQADVQFRPLLVEGVAAQPRSKNDRWRILIDSEVHSSGAATFTSESTHNRLSVRLRNTLAHELGHALIGRVDEVAESTSLTIDELVIMLEKEAERLSPAFLVPRKRLLEFLNSSAAPLTVTDLVAERDRLGVSSFVFAQRLELTKQEDNTLLRYHPRLKDIAVGTGDNSPYGFELNPFPFSGFTGMLPEFLAILRSGKKFNITPDLAPDALTDVSAPTIANVWFGTNAHPRSERRQIEFSSEAKDGKSRASSLWLARET